MYGKSSPPQQDDMAEAWTTDLLVFEQTLYYWAILLSCQSLNKWYIVWNKSATDVAAYSRSLDLDAAVYVARDRHTFWL